MFRLEWSDLGLVLDPLQKLFRRSRTGSQEFVAAICDLVYFSPSATLGFPDRLEVALLFHGVEERVEGSGAEIDFEPVPDLPVDLISPAGRCLQEEEHYQNQEVLNEA